MNIRRTLGASGIDVSPLGLGCMGLSGSYGAIEPEDARGVIRHALDAGIDFLDTADFYGRGGNEELIGDVLKDIDRPAVVATKTGVGMGPDRKPVLKGHPDQLKAACEGSLSRLKVETVDLFILARVDPSVPIEDSVGAMADLVAAGTVRAIGLSAASASTLRRAHAVHPLAAVETEYSLMERGVEQDVLPVLRDLGISLIAYSPFGRGLLAGALSTDMPFETGDFRQHNPRFSEANRAANLERIALMDNIARAHGATRAQVALAWLLAKGDDILPIFGTRSPERITSNLEALSLQLSEDDIETLDGQFPVGWAIGDRYPPAMMALIDGDAV